MRILLMFVCVISLCTPTFAAEPVNKVVFHYSGESNEVGRAYVSKGTAETLTLEKFNFLGTVYDEGARFEVTITNETRHAVIEFDSGTSQTLNPREYKEAMRYAFNRDGKFPKPGLNFSMDHRGNNQVAGEFTVLEARYIPGQGFQSFAADFIQIGDNGVKEFGSIRLNSAIPLSVP